MEKNIREILSGYASENIRTRTPLRQPSAMQGCFWSELILEAPSAAGAQTGRPPLNI